MSDILVKKVDNASRDVKLGWIGLGAIGSALATHTLQAGYSVTVYNRSPQKAAGLAAAGATVAASVAEISENCDIVFAALPGWEQSERVCKELFAGAGRPDIYVELSTLSPKSVQSLAEIANRYGAAFVDAPVSGTADQRAVGDMTVLCGAEVAVFERLKPVLSTFAKNISLLGPVGSGSLAKVCNQLMVMSGLIAATEALELGFRHGLAIEPLHSAIMHSSGSARSLALVAREYVHRTYRTVATPRAALRLAVKDLEEAVGLAREVGLRIELAEAALAIWRRADMAGLGDDDIYTIIDEITANGRDV